MREEKKRKRTRKVKVVARVQYNTLFHNTIRNKYWAQLKRVINAGNASIFYPGVSSYFSQHGLYMTCIKTKFEYITESAKP